MIPFIKQVYFYGIVCTCIAIIMKFMNVCDVDVYILTSQSLIPLFGTWWFVAVYFILIFLSKAINSIMDKLDNKKILVLVVIVMIWYSVGLIVHSSYYPLLRGVYYYMVGAWIRREKIQCKKSKGIIVFIISWTIYFLLSFFVAGRGGRDSLGVIGDGVRFMQFVIISPAAATSIFLLFKQMEIRTSKIINYLGAASFAVYLFHEAPYNRILLWNHIFVPKRAWETVLFPIYSVFACVCVYSIVLLIEWVRSNLGKGALRVEMDPTDPESGVDSGFKIYANMLRGKDTLSLIVTGNDGQFTVTALFDNLGKGASGAAVQNMNLMLGFEETAGLNL